MLYKVEVLVRNPKTNKIVILKKVISGMKIVNKFLFTVDKEYDIGGYTIKSMLN